MTYTFLLRIIDNFFRSWIRYLLPIVLLASLGLATADRTDQFASTGTVLVETESFLSQLTQVRDNGFAFATPGSVAQTTLNGLLGTDSFSSDVLARVGGDDAEITPILLNQLRRSISSSVRSGSFLSVTAIHADAESARILATAVLDEFVEWQIANDIEQSQTAEDFYQSILSDSLLELDGAKQQLEDFLLANPDPVAGARATSELIELESLQANVTNAQASYDRARGSVEAAALATAQAETDIRQTFRVVDVPVAPDGPEPWTTDLIIRGMFFMVLGIALSASVLLLTTVTDTSVRFPTEVRARLGTEVLAVVPSAPR